MNLDVEYDNRARVPEFAGILQQWQVDAEQYRLEAGGQLDVSYGDHERQKTDIFGYREGRKKPLVVFIHGGYWQALGRESFSHMAKGLNQLGYGVLVPSYRLCPAAFINDIIADMRLLCAWVWRKFERKLVVTGHSAGGHLAAAMLATDWAEYDLPDDLVTAGFGVSGLYDLRPLITTPLNTALKLDDRSAQKASPLLWPSPTGKRFEAWVGGDESAEFIRQSNTIAACWTGAGVSTNAVQVPNKNHFTVIDGLTDAASDMTKMIANLANDI